MPQLTMPKMGDAMEEGTILRWLKNEGDPIEEGDPVAEIQTEKATIEVPATASGVLSRILVQPDQTVTVGTPIAEVNGAGGEGAPAEAPEKTQGKAAAEEAPPAAPQEGPPETEAPATPKPAAKADREQPPGAESPAPPSPGADRGRGATAPGARPEATPKTGQRPGVPSEETRVKASPLARKVAAEHGIDLSAIEGTGPGGRIIEADVEEARERGPAPKAAPAPRPAQPEPGTERPMTPMRRVIARRVTQSKQTIPHFYLALDTDMRAAVRLRAEYNAAAGEERKVSFNDLVVRACALALEQFPALNSRLEDETIKTPSTINIGVAVALDEGLIVPVVRDAQNKSVAAIGREVRRLAERARQGELAPEEYSGGTFTVSNLGMYDIILFQAVINPPEAAILAVGAIRDTPIVENDQIAPGKQMYLALSVDHRLVDGHVAAQFLQEVQRLLENPLSLFG
jgi:pyruvate dehydrogenase E2 component (dihydrolipoyllysine-residue acetyltransferase)